MPDRFNKTKPFPYVDNLEIMAQVEKLDVIRPISTECVFANRVTKKSGDLQMKAYFVCWFKCV